ncbi:Tse2 family ADP-ribosyltransferase toxin [Vibrio sp. YIC-376]|uniref:Tse2 family ADP-ribosyltransferase toxin n=1 Tax=Vibrio sp. YIC-376 TaxID=3136162 RepID=UPI00402AE693
MYERVNKSKYSSKADAISVVQKKNKIRQGVSFVDNRPLVITQRKRQQAISSCSTVQFVTLYRGMQANAPGGNMPLLGNNSGFELGVRNTEGTDNPGGWVNPQSGGTSTSNPRADIPSFTASKHYPEGTHNTDDNNLQTFRWIWSLDDNTLPGILVARNDHGSHYSIEPAVGQQLTRVQFQNAVQGTQANWNRIDN